MFFTLFCQRSKKVKFSFSEDENTYYLLFSLSYCFFYTFCSFFILRLTLWLIIQAKTSPKALCTVNFTPPLLLFRESLKVKFFLKGQIFFDFYTHKNILYAETSKNINTSFAVYIICIEGGQKPAVKSERRILDELLWRMRQQRSFDTCHHHNPALCGR